MAQLFSLGTLKDNTANLNGFNQSKIDIIQDLYNDYKNGLLDDEVKYKEKFNQVFFGELLGYENRIHRIPEGHIKGVGNADIVLGNFVDGKEDAELIQIACELKGAKSNLVKKQYGHGGLSPVGQGFSYKTGLKNCKWLIVSNFFETRLYRDNQTDFEVWDLETLLDSKDDYFNLRSLYLLLHKDNLLAENGTSKTEDLLSHFRDEQLEITKKFYKEYKQLRLDLLEDIKKRNPLLSVNTLVEKGQKIIDRLIFIFFCEDRGLLPDKKLKEGIERAGEFDISPRDMTKRFFKGVDQGSVKLEIPDGYNGGLFKDDATLNSLNVGDEICKKFVELTNYDFHDDLSVSVLGHIFEQSISDLEEIKEDLIGKESKVLQESKGRRKKDGIFYTPEYIVDYIVQNSVMKYLNEKEDECLKKHNNKKNGEILAYQEYQHILQNIKVLDPACGSGAFLVRVFDVLFEENKRVGSILNSLFDDTEAYKNILTNNIYGVDLNDESVEITKLSLWLKSAQKGKKLNNLDSNIKCGNSLIDDAEIAGDKAFDWNIEFKDIMDEGGFDVIVGNPPYVRIQNLDGESKNFICENYITASKGNIDLYIPFIEKSLGLINDAGRVGFITPSVWIYTQYGEALVNLSIKNKYLEQFVDYGSFQVFQDATTYTAIQIFSKKDKNYIDYVFAGSGVFIESDISKISYKRLESLNTLKTYKYEKLFKKINTGVTLGDISTIFVGIQTSADDIYHLKNLGNGKYYSKHLKTDIEIEETYLKPICSGENIRRYVSINTDMVVIFPYQLDGEKVNLIEESIIAKTSPKLYAYLKECENKLRGREKGKMDHKGRYGYVYPKNIVRQSLRKLAIGRLVSKMQVALDNLGEYVLDNVDVNGISITDISLRKYEFLQLILNSSVINFFFVNTAKPFRGDTFSANKQYLSPIPLPKDIENIDQQPFIERANKMLSLNKEFYEKIDMILKFLQQKYGLEKLSKKLQKFYELDFKDFVKQLKIKNISMEEERELMQLFEKDKAEVLVLKEEIDSADREIDGMVCDLYGLSEEDRKVVLDV